MDWTLVTDWLPAAGTFLVIFLVGWLVTWRADRMTRARRNRHH